MSCHILFFPDVFFSLIIQFTLSRLLYNGATRSTTDHHRRHPSSSTRTASLSIISRHKIFLPRSQGHSTNRRLLFFSFFFSWSFSLFLSFLQYCRAFDLSIGRELEFLLLFKHPLADAGRRRSSFAHRDARPTSLSIFLRAAFRRLSRLITLSFFPFLSSLLSCSRSYSFMSRARKFVQRENGGKIVRRSSRWNEKSGIAERDPRYRLYRFFVRG